jgi:hypothetical protein
MMSKGKRFRFSRRSLAAPARPDKREFLQLARLAEYVQQNPPQSSRKPARNQARRIHHVEAGDRASATAFADWVFWQINPHYEPEEHATSSVQMMWSGAYDHAQIEKLRLWLCRERRAAPLFEKAGRWEPIYVDSHNGAGGCAFAASCLTVYGKPVGGRPDVVLRDGDSGGVIVLERKVLQRGVESVPRDGYANHWCQLWCYGWMDAWADAPYVLLALQYWHRDWTRGPLARKDDTARIRFCRSPRFHAWALDWFKRYGGTFAAGTVSCTGADRSSRIGERR